MQAVLHFGGEVTLRVVDRFYQSVPHIAIKITTNQPETFCRLKNNAEIWFVFGKFVVTVVFQNVPQSLHFEFTVWAVRKFGLQMIPRQRISLHKIAEIFVVFEKRMAIKPCREFVVRSVGAFGVGIGEQQRRDSEVIIIVADFGDINRVYETSL